MPNTYPSAALQEITEYRGVEGLVAAEVLMDNNETGEGQGYVTGPVLPLQVSLKSARQQSRAMKRTTMTTSLLSW